MLPLIDCRLAAVPGEPERCRAVRDRYLGGPTVLQPWRDVAWPIADIPYRPLFAPVPSLAGAAVTVGSDRSVTAWRLAGDGSTADAVSWSGTPRPPSRELTDGLVVYAADTPEGSWRLHIGNPFPNDDREGALVLERADGARDVVLEALRRPVHADVRRVDEGELLVSEFGHTRGRLALWSRDAGTWTPTVLFDGAGTIRARFTDMDSDGDTDVLALVAQENERLVAFERVGELWRQHTLLRFPASWGSVTFRLSDLDDDQREDLLVVNGDNADLPEAPVRPYHGVRGYERTGPWTFEERWHVPLPGAYDVARADVDQDGVLETVVAAAFVDQEQPVGLAVIEHTEPWSATPYEVSGAPRAAACRLATRGETSVAVVWCGSYLAPSAPEAAGILGGER